MRNLFLFLLIVIGALRLTGQITKPAGKTYALVIGISGYQNKALPLLKYADKDATLFARWLLSKPVPVPEIQVKLLLNEQATIGAIYDALDWLRESCSSGDTGYIYFSGHGDVETNSNFSKGYLLAYNTPPNNYRNNAIRVEDLNSQANIISVKNKANIILITDACHSGKLAGDFYKGKQLVANELSIILNNEVRLASCAFDEEAAEGPDWGGGRGVFSYYLLRGLDGMADLKKDGSVQLQELTKFLDSAFATDKYLQLNKHKQHPVTDGNPYFPLGEIGAIQAAKIQAEQFPIDSNLSSIRSLKIAGMQPIDYFFSIFKSQPVENYISFKNFITATPEELPASILDAAVTYQQSKAANTHSLGSFDSLQLLRDQLLKNKTVVKRFNEQFIRQVHEKAQDMVNAYLAGDLSELEKRQYYYAGNRQYRDFLPMLQTAIQIAPSTHSLTGLLKVQYSYLSGLIDRLQMATSNNTKNLLRSAFKHQWQAMELEPHAAYIQNELGNLYMHQKRFDSADYHYKMATVLSPTWAIPWSNQVRLGLAMKQPAKAIKAIHVADSLQPGLAYVNVNAGLVMEQTGNLLAAISFYKKAIAQNNVHFLPYERLGNIYMRTGDFTAADSALFNARIRKDSFSVNGAYFAFGAELGGDLFNPFSKEKPVCGASPVIASSATLQPYVQLEMALQRLEDSARSKVSIIQLLQVVIKQQPDIPFAHHFLGKLLYRQERWQDAADVLVKAIEKFTQPAVLKAQLKKALYGNHITSTDTCFLKLLMYYQYDQLEDHYLLAAIYEQQGMIEQAIAQYKLIAGIEDKRQQDQAQYLHFKEAAEEISGIRDVYPGDILKLMYDQPIEMGGALKLARSYERLGQYAAAEKVLLIQVQSSRAAGDQRQLAIDQKIPGTWQITGPVNFYWLGINRAIEGATYNFYQRMMTLFPRDHQWKENAGLFLYHRLAMAYKLLLPAEYSSFHTSLKKYRYPWQSGETPAEEDSVIYHLPGTGDTLVIPMHVYDPLEQSLGYLQQSVQLSGDLEPSLLLLEVLANLNSWLGQTKTAGEQYSKLLTALPANDTIRNKLINILAATNELPKSMDQLEILWRRKQIVHKQVPTLAAYFILAGKYDKAQQVLNNFHPVDKMEKATNMSLYARMYLLLGNNEKALKYLRDSIPVLRIDPKDDAADLAININQQIMNQYRRYSMARLYALMNNSTNAMAQLKLALDAGFRYREVLDNDQAWDKWRHTHAWNKLLDRYTFEDKYSVNTEPVFRELIGYRIPGLKD